MSASQCAIYLSTACICTYIFCLSFQSESVCERRREHIYASVHIHHITIYFGFYFNFHFSSVFQNVYIIVLRVYHRCKNSAQSGKHQAKRFAASNVCVYVYLCVFFKHISKYVSLLSYTGLMRMIESPYRHSFAHSLSSIFHALNQMKCMFSINFLRRYRSHAVPLPKH